MGVWGSAVELYEREIDSEPRKFSDSRFNFRTNGWNLDVWHLKESKLLDRSDSALFKSGK